MRSYELFACTSVCGGPSVIRRRMLHTVVCLQLLAQAAAIQHEAAQHIDRELALKLPR